MKPAGIIYIHDPGKGKLPASVVVTLAIFPNFALHY